MSYLEPYLAKIRQMFNDPTRKRRVEESIQGPPPKYIKISHESRNNDTSWTNCYQDGFALKKTPMRKSTMGSIMSKFKTKSNNSCEPVELDEYSDSEDIITAPETRKSSFPSLLMPINVIQHHKMDRSKDNNFKLATTRPVPNLISRDKFSNVQDLQKCYSSLHNINFTRPQHINGYSSENESNMVKGGLLNGNGSSSSSFKPSNNKYQGNNLNFKKTVSNLFNSKSSRVPTSHVPIQDDIIAKLRYEKLLKSVLPPEHNYRDTSSSLWGSSNRHSVKRNDVPKARPPIGSISYVDLCNDDIKRMEDTALLLSQSSIHNEHKVTPVNSMLQKFETKNVFQNSFYDNLTEKYSSAQRQREEQISRQEARIAAHSDTLAKDRLSYEDRIPSWTRQNVVIFDEDIEEKIDDFPEFDEQQRTIIRQAMVGHPNTVLISKFNSTITRDHIRTLQWDPLTWLNDEVINFYMNLLTERGELRSNDGYPKVYAMNTFFTQRLYSGGYAAVRRWTKKVDIFACDIIPVPVHVGNVHWCMAIINMKEKTIKYYDSMGSPNNKILLALESYLKEESLDKRKVVFDFSDWTTENVTDNPRQQNGSDCGVFSCMTAEFTCRNRPIVFNQQHMNYFRQKMVYEICVGKLLL